MKVVVHNNFYFQPQPRPELIDIRVVDGHIIPDKVLFTKATSDDIPYPTLAFSDNIKVTISFAKTDDGKRMLFLNENFVFFTTY